jgi:hypothetical protein
MYFTWAWRDARLRQFIVDVVAGPDGRWSVQRLTDKANSEFFEQWLSGSSPQKARSNIEFFLEETGIYDTTSRNIRLDLSDGWLAEAMTVAAQHEPDVAIREAMVRDPIGILRALRLLSLADISETAASGTAMRQPLADPSQLPDDDSAPASYAPPADKTWTDRDRRPIVAGGNARNVDPIALERANASHLRLERILAGLLKQAGCEPRNSSAIDMYARTANGTVLVEIKSCHSNNVHAQIRRGLSQLLEYEFIYRNVLGPLSAKALLIETEPPARKRWLVELLSSIGITLAWKEADADRFVTSAPIPKALAGFVASA